MKNKKKLLLVEDDPLVIRLMELTLGLTTFHLEVATTFHDGRRALQSGAFDLVLLDVSLPGGSGFELARHIRASGTKRTPILMLTALRQENSRDRGLACGADAYMTKPFSPSAVRDAIQLLLTTSHHGRTRISTARRSRPAPGRRVGALQRGRRAPRAEAIQRREVAPRPAA